MFCIKLLLKFKINQLDVSTTSTPLRKCKNEKLLSWFIEKMTWFSNIDYKSFKVDNI